MKDDWSALSRHVTPSALAAACAIFMSGCGGGGDSTSTAQANAESLCNGFTARTVEGAVVTSAKLFASQADAPEHCLVRGEMPEDLVFEVRLPTSWNKRTLFMGQGGFGGSIDPAPKDLAVAGYATIATNSGHTGGIVDGSFFVNEGMLKDYAYLSVPRVLAPAKAILRERYGKDFEGTKTVFDGCSRGGQQGLIQAQRFPDLFDGVIARAPANAYTPQFLWYQVVDKQLAQPGAALSQAKVNAISAAVLAKCDALDGIADNMISRPQACSFDPAELACTGAETDSCLTSAQIQSARTFYAPTNVANGRYTWPGFLPGGESIGWTNPFRGVLASEYWKYMVTKDPAADYLQLDPAQYTGRIDQLVAMIDAVYTDLSRFKALGGKLMLWHGLNDWFITANNSTAYYQSVVQTSGGQAAADEFVEYYTSPSVQHCGGGTGADKFDLITPMFDWVEKGIKPSTERIVATQSSVPTGTPPFARPLCKFPQYPKYVSGDPSSVESFVCTTP